MRPKRRRLKPGRREVYPWGLPALGSGQAPPETGDEETAAILPASGARSLTEPDETARRKKPSARPSRRLSPEEKELRHKSGHLTVLEGELARQELRLANLRAEMLPFEARYYRRIGIRCAKLDQLEAEIAELEARLDPERQGVQVDARRARERAERSRAAVRRKLSEGSFDPPAALKRLYRAVARRVHPDYGEDSIDRGLRARLMAHANRAYRRGDERRLRAIVSEYEFGPEAVRGEGTPLSLVRVIRKIALVRGRLSEIGDELEQTRTSELYRFKARVETNEKKGRDLFAEVARAVNENIAKARQKRRNLMSAARAVAPPRRDARGENSEEARASAFARGCVAE